MKKYLLGLFALVLAVGFTAFTTIPFRTTVTFNYNSTDFSEDAVETLTNWIDANGSPACASDVLHKACTIEVPIANVTGTTPGSRTLTTSGQNMAVINALLYSTGSTYYVNDFSGTVDDTFNKN